MKQIAPSTVYKGQSVLNWQSKLFVFWYLLYEYLPDINMLEVTVFVSLAFLLTKLNHLSVAYHGRKELLTAGRFKRERSM